MHPHDLAAVAEGIAEFYEPLAAGAGIRLTAHAVARPTVAIDIAMVQRALSNLLSNSLAFTPTGGAITITTRVQGDRAVIEVVDTGCGIAPDRLPTIFDGAYTQAVTVAPKATRTGLGIGLSIVRSIMRLHDGSVDIASRPGQGCRVSLWFA